MWKVFERQGSEFEGRKESIRQKRMSNNSEAGFVPTWAVMSMMIMMMMMMMMDGQKLMERVVGISESNARLWKIVSQAPKLKFENSIIVIHCSGQLSLRTTK